jgi:hypothetical protein
MPTDILTAINQCLYLDLKILIYDHYLHNWCLHNCRCGQPKTFIKFCPNKGHPFWNHCVCGIKSQVQKSTGVPAIDQQFAIQISKLHAIVSKVYSNNPTNIDPQVSLKTRRIVTKYVCSDSDYMLAYERFLIYLVNTKTIALTKKYIHFIFSPILTHNPHVQYHRKIQLPFFEGSSLRGRGEVRQRRLV